MPKVIEKSSSVKVPAALGFKMPAEWEKQEATWLAWPHNVETWPGKRLARVEETYLQMLEGILPNQKVNLLVCNSKTGELVKKRLETMSIRTKNLVLREVENVDAWIRDYGPTFIKSTDHSPRTTEKKLKNKLVDSRPSTVGSDKAYVKWIFNAWGSKYASLMEDTHVFSDTSLIPYPCFDAGIVMEGGSIEVNGVGTCLTTEQCLLNKNRNPQLSRKQIEKYLCDYLGVSHIVWLKEGIVGDDTDGHIDDIARFVNADTILTVFEEDKKDENYPILKENYEDLKKAIDQDGKKWNIVKLPMPGVIADGDVRLPASYANFLLANEVVLLPTYGHKNDKAAVKILQELFPKREIIPIRCNDLVYGLGAIHCVSQQESL